MLSYPIKTGIEWKRMKKFGWDDCKLCDKHYNNNNYKVLSTPAEKTYKYKICNFCFRASIKEWEILIEKHKIEVDLSEYIDSKLLAEKLSRT